MTIFLETPRRPSALTIAGGEAGLGTIAAAGRDSLLYVDNGNSAHAALDRAIEDRIARIHAATGVKAENPLRKAEEEWRIAEAENLSAALSGTGAERRSLQDVTQQHIDRFEGDLFALGEKFPDAREAIGADRPLFEDAKRIAREADERLSQLMDSRGGLAKYGALLAGGMVGALNDPITLASLMAGAGPGAARTVASRILTVAGKEAIINAGTEGFVQAGVQKWREEVGLDHGLDQAIRNVLFAGLLGGAFGTAGQGIAEGARRFVRPADIDRAAESLRGNERLAEPARAIIDGDGLRAAESLATIRDSLPAEARGAIDQAAIIRATDAQRPAGARADIHDMAVARADRIVRMPDAEMWQPFPTNEEQIARVVREIVGPDIYDAAPTERTLTGFLIDRGGISDFRGELRAIGADRVSERFRGRLMREDGDSLDYAREAAAEAGYFNHLYGTPDEASARSTIADLLNLLEEDIRGNPVTPGMAGRTDATDFEAARAGVEGIVAEIARLAGPAVDDALLARATRIAMDEGGDPFDALERVLLTDELSAPRARSDQGDDLPPGWSDEELLAASRQRGLTAEPDGIDDPVIRRPDDEISEADIAAYRADGHDTIIDDAGNVVPIDRYLADIARDDELATIMKACRA